MVKTVGVVMQVKGLPESGEQFLRAGMGRRRTED